MFNQRWRPVWFFVLALLAVWVIAITGYTMAKNSRVTAEKIRRYAKSVDLRTLSGAARAKAIQKLADMLNGLSVEERRRARMERAAGRWFEEMTEEEKGTFIEATMPSGFKQMLNAFEQMPEEKRRRAVDDALRRLKEAQGQNQMQPAGAAENQGSTNGLAPLSEELQTKVKTIGLKTFYSQSTAQTKAELAPVLEELQRVMESGRPFRGR